MPPTPIKLDYSLTPRPFPWLRFAIWATALALLLAAGFYLYKWSTPRFQAKRLEDQCLNFTTPPDTHTFYSHFVGNGEKLLDFSTCFGNSRDDWEWRMGCGASNFLSPQCWQQYRAKCNVQPQVRGGGRHGYRTPLLFLHQRTAPSGVTRLVHVEAAIYDHADKPGWYLCWNIIEPGGFWSTPRLVNSGKATFQAVSPSFFYHGLPNPNNASSFSFDCIDNGSRITFQGQLHNDDTVSFTSPYTTIIATRPASTQNASH